MKKYLLYILIIITLVGTLSPLKLVRAESGTCVTTNKVTRAATQQSMDRSACNTANPPAGFDVSFIPSNAIPLTPNPNATAPAQTQTQPDKKYTLLAPLPCAEGTPGCEGGQLTTFDPTGDNKIGGYLNVMLRIFIGICAVLAVIMIVIGGMEYMTSELISNKEHGKEKIRDAILGLLLALGAYTLLFTINPNLLNTDLKTLSTQEITVNIDDNVPQTPVNGRYPNSNYKFGDPWGDNIGLIQNIPGVTKNYPECTTVGQPPGCLSTRNLDLSAINEIKAKCPNAQLVLNGGTEFWHHGGSKGVTTHGPGSSTIDLAINSNLNSCLSGGQPLVAFTRYPTPNGPYYYEGNHWHIGR